MAERVLHIYIVRVLEALAYASCSSFTQHVGDRSFLYIVAPHVLLLRA